VVLDRSRIDTAIASRLEAETDGADPERHIGDDVGDQLCALGRSAAQEKPTWLPDRSAFC
jgi:hypothetical protein